MPFFSMIICDELSAEIRAYCSERGMPMSRFLQRLVLDHFLMTGRIDQERHDFIGQKISKTQGRPRRLSAKAGE